MNEIETVRALFGGPAEPEPTPEPDIITGPVIPGQERQPAYQNKTATGSFIDRLFDN